MLSPTRPSASASLLMALAALGAGCALPLEYDHTAGMMEEGADVPFAAHFDDEADRLRAGETESLGEDAPIPATPPPGDVNDADVPPPPAGDVQIDAPVELEGEPLAPDGIDTPANGGRVTAGVVSISPAAGSEQTEFLVEFHVRSPSARYALIDERGAIVVPWTTTPVFSTTLAAGDPEQGQVRQLLGLVKRDDAVVGESVSIEVVGDFALPAGCDAD